MVEGECEFQSLSAKRTRTAEDEVGETELPAKRTRATGWLEGGGGTGELESAETEGVRLGEPDPLVVIFSTPATAKPPGVTGPAEIEVGETAEEDFGPPPAGPAPSASSPVPSGSGGAPRGTSDVEFGGPSDPKSRSAEVAQGQGWPMVWSFKHHQHKCLNPHGVCLQGKFWL